MVDKLFTTIITISLIGLGFAQVAQPANNQAEIPNPIVQYSSIEQVEEATGLEVHYLENLSDDYEINNISAIDNKVIEIVYGNTENKICYREAKGNYDISGDYNDYTIQNHIDLPNGMLTLKGNEDEYYLAIWTDGTYSYSLSSKEALSQKDMLTLVTSIK